MKPISNCQATSSRLYQFHLNFNSMLISTTDDNKLRIWKIGHHDGSLLLINTLVSEALSKLTVTASYVMSLRQRDNLIKCWDLNDQDKSVYRTFSYNHLSDISSSMNQGKSILYGCTYNGKIALWDIYNGAMINEIISQDDSIITIKNYNNDYFFTGAGSAIKLWDNRYLQQPVHEMNHHKSMVFGMEISPNDQVILSYSSDGQVVAWNALTGQILSEINVGYVIIRILRLDNAITIQGKDFIEIYDFNGNRTSTLGNDILITSCYSSNNQLYIGSNEYNVSVVNNFGIEKATLIGNKSPTTAIIAYDGWVYTGGNDGIIYQYFKPN